MALFNIDFFFDSTDGYGWSERHFFSGSDLDTAMAAALSLADARLQILPPPMLLVWIRGSTPGIPPNSRLLRPTSSLGVYTVTAGASVLPSENRILLTIFGTDVIKNRKFLGGVVSQDVAIDKFLPTADWNTQFAALEVSLRVAGWVVAKTYKVGEVQETAPIVSDAVGEFIARRKPGRPFGFRPGRRRIA